MILQLLKRLKRRKPIHCNNVGLKAQGELKVIISGIFEAICK